MKIMNHHVCVDFFREYSRREQTGNMVNLSGANGRRGFFYTGPCCADKKKPG